MTGACHPALIAWPEKAAFGRSVPKARIYQHAGANTRMKELFVREVDQIVWQFKLAPETINLPAGVGAPEIQIFGMQLKTGELHRDILRCIDGAIPFPILFELSFEGRIQVIASYKRLGEADSKRCVPSDYFATEWLPANGSRAAMPVALSLTGLYEQILLRLVPLAARPGESLGCLIERASKVRAVQREIERVDSYLEKERQFNRKVEINTKLRLLKNEFKALSK